MAFQRRNQHEYSRWEGPSSDSKPGVAEGAKFMDLLWEYDTNHYYRYTIVGWVRTTNDVYIQDQVSEPLGLIFSMEVQGLTVETDTNIDDYTITVSAAAQPTVGNIACFKEGVRHLQAVILTSVANGGNWDIGIDQPLDFAYTSAATASEVTSNMVVDGSSSPKIFKVSPSGLSSVKWDITSVSGSILDQTDMDDNLFGGITALTKGIVLRLVDGTYKNLGNIKKNGQFRQFTFDVEYSPKAPAGYYGLQFFKRYSGQGNNGVALRLNSETDDEIQMIVQDDLRDLNEFYMLAQGHVVV